VRTVLVDLAAQPDDVLGEPGPDGGEVIDVRDGVLLRARGTDEAVALAVPFGGSMGEVRAAIRGFPMTTISRGGVYASFRNRGSNLGFSARMVVMQRYVCRTCGIESEAPGAHATIVGFGAIANEQLGSVLPEVVEADRATAGVVLPEWRIPETPWTSGVLNKDSALPLHYDRNNLPTWNATLYCRRGVRGGHLFVPSIGAAIACPDGYVLFMPAHRMIHGVTPMRRDAADAYRFSAVLFTSARMQHCLPAEAEMAEARVRRTDAEDHLRERQTAQGLLAE
jgi:hypothetical protein